MVGVVLIVLALLVLVLSIAVLVLVLESALGDRLASLDQPSQHRDDSLQFRFAVPVGFVIDTFEYEYEYEYRAAP